MERNPLVTHVSSNLNVVDVVGKYVALTKSGRNHKGLCPFHNESTPSFLVSEEKNIYKCFGCGEGGDAISFYSKMEGMSYMDAARRLAGQIGVSDDLISKYGNFQKETNFEKEHELLAFVAGFYHYYLLNTEEGQYAVKYLMDRGMTHEVIKAFGIGLAPKSPEVLLQALRAKNYSFELAKLTGVVAQQENGDYYPLFKSRIMFVVSNEHNKIVGFSGRTYETGDDYAKYINSPESKLFQKSKLIYRLHEAKKVARTRNRILLFEGFLDVIAASSAGLNEAVATMGTALTTNHAKKISRYTTNVILCFDGDAAGIAATAKAIPILMAQNLRTSVVKLPSGIDPDDYIKQFGKTKFNELVNNAVGALDFLYDYEKRGLDLTKTDDVIEYEKRLTALGNLYGVGNELLWRYRKAEKRSMGTQANTKYSRHYNKNNKNLTHHSNLINTLLQTTPKEIKAEKELIYYMLLHQDVFNIVNAQIGTSFNTDDHRKIVQALEAYYVTGDQLNIEMFITSLRPELSSVVQDILQQLKSRPKTWTNSMIIELCNTVKHGALKLQWDEKKPIFLQANYEKQLMMMSERTSSIVD